MSDNLPSSRLDIVQYLQAKDDIPSVKRILSLHPDIEGWPEFYIGQHQTNCCVLNILLEAGVLPETLALYWSALTNNDHLVLEFLLRHRASDADEFFFKTAVKRSSEEILNLMARYQDPGPYLPELAPTMEEEGVHYKEGHFVKPDRVEPGFLDEPCTEDEARKAVDGADSPKAIQQFALIYPELFSEFLLSKRKRRPVIIQTLAILGCPGVRFEPHMCDAYMIIIELCK
ncbi:uncharacterized protein EV422DRAFT_564275 [Fimicolochytrium jonesii]|uniref:uncharacterized protein n=1 Tax=Fimicolochytrium jonesii TaxID=1396493 RepID=UPI0022FEF78F|nr:uncharacterized protein EV422DRAFT_564275 [Fimicolochytrium jonesii]KAI8824916.1 hypothetical protein EV422DRAFT_564275 [Fimicolochytrium jonesii]